jgi:hypothetical protein
MIGHHSHKFYDIKPIYSVDAEGRHIVSVCESDFEKLARQCFEQKQEPRYFGASQDNDNKQEKEIKSYNLMSMITGNGQTIPFMMTLKLNIVVSMSSTSDKNRL